MEGWLKLHRRLLHSKQFANAIDLKVWIWLLCKASSKDRSVTIRIGPHTHSLGLTRGQVIFGRTTAERELSIDGSTIYKVIQRMATDNLISIQSNNHFSIITLTDYIEEQDFPRIEDFELYEDVATSEQPNNNPVAGPEQDRSRTVTQLKKVNKGKKVKNEEKGKEGASAPQPLVAPEGSPEWKKFFDWIEEKAPRVHRMKQPFTEQQFEEMKREWPPQATRDILLAMQNYKPLHTKNMSAYLTAINWLKRDQKNATHRPPAGPGPAKQGISAARIEALRNWGNHRTGEGAGG